MGRNLLVDMVYVLFLVRFTIKIRLSQAHHARDRALAALNPTFCIYGFVPTMAFEQPLNLFLDHCTLHPMGTDGG